MAREERPNQGTQVPGLSAASRLTPVKTLPGGAPNLITGARRPLHDARRHHAHGWRGMTRLLLGSETQKVLLSTDVPVLVYH